MNEPASNSLNEAQHVASSYRLCEICYKNDEEDFYIVFNALYRGITGDIFTQTPKGPEIAAPPDGMPEEKHTVTNEETRMNATKMQHFQDSISLDVLSGVILSPQFDQILKETFRSKYPRIPESACDHQELLRRFVRSFNVRETLPEGTHMQQEQIQRSIERLAALLNSIRHLKNQITHYHTEISQLSNHIATRLFSPHSGHNSTTEERNKREREEEMENMFGDGGTRKRLITEQTKNGSSRAEESTAMSSGNSGGSNADARMAIEAKMDGSGSSNENYDDSSDAEDSTKKDDKSGKKKSRVLPFKSKLPKKATDILKKWFLNNINNPYPTHEIKETLSIATSLNKKQIQNWFTNSRKRFLEPLKKKLETQKSRSPPGPLEIPEPRVDPAITFQQKQNIPEPLQPVIMQETISLPTNLNAVLSKPLLQIKQFQQFPNPGPSIISPQTMKPLTPPQRIAISPVALQNQPFMFQGLMPPGNFPQNGGVVILPYYVPQAAMPFQYRPPEMVPVNHPSFVQIQQPGMPMMEQPIVNNSVFNPPYIAIQPNFMDPRTAQQPPQNLSTNFNTINNNVFNNINPMGGMQPLNPQWSGLPSFGGVNMPNMQGQPIINPMEMGYPRMMEKPMANPSEVYQCGPGTIYEGNASIFNGRNMQKHEGDFLSQQARKMMP